MNINELSKKSHENAIEKGFYDCGECGGSGRIHNEDSHNFDKSTRCGNCMGTGIDQNKNIPELLMLCITEISEAVEALRCGRFADWEKYIKGIAYGELFEAYIKDTFEDEIADVFIRLFDIAGYLEIEFIENRRTEKLTGNICEDLFETIEDLVKLKAFVKTNKKRIYFEYTICQLIEFCNYYKIDIEKHITAKQAYNKTRPKKHGKEF